MYKPWHIHVFTHVGLLEFFFFFWLFMAAPAAYGRFQVRSQIRAAAAGLYHSHSVGSKSHLQLTPELTQQPTERSQGLNFHPQGY